MITLDIYKNDIKVNHMEDAEKILLNILVTFVCRENINGSRIGGKRTAEGDHIITVFLNRIYKYVFTISEV